MNTWTTRAETDADIPAIRDCGLHIGADPLGGASVDYWAIAPMLVVVGGALVGVLVEELVTDRLLDFGAQFVVGVLVPTQLLNHHAVRNAELMSVILRVRRGDHGGVLPLYVWVQ